MTDDRCPACGAPVSGREGCQALMDEVQARAYTDPRFGATFNLGFDAYCMQHPEEYGLSAKSYAAHLTRLCCGGERGGEEAIYRAINAWLSTNPPLDKPPLLATRGQMTIADLAPARDASEHNRLAREWAASVWQAYASQHDLARRWIELALSTAGAKHHPHRR
jgi:hypothetical protein